MKPPIEKNSRFIPKAVKMEVRKRDNGQCSFISKDGKRCRERHALEIDHIKPYSIGGTNGIENLRLLCPTHSKLSAENFFGKEKINAYSVRN